jgi:hypothetical protein
MKRFLGIAFVAGTVLSSVPANGQSGGVNTGNIRITEFRRQTPGCAPTVTISLPVTTGVDSPAVTYTTSQCAEFVRIVPDPLDLNMPQININVTSPIPVDVTLGNSLNQAGGDPASVGHNLRGIAVSGAGRFYGGISGTLINNITADQIFRFDADVAINGGVFANNAGNFSIFVVDAGSFGPNAIVQCSNGPILRVSATSLLRGTISAGTNINQVSVSAGDLTATNIEALQGAIGTVSASGKIGSSGSPTVISARDGITRVTATEIFGTITANANGGNGNIASLVTTSGNFVGSLAARNILASAAPRGITVAGTLDASIQIPTGNIDEPITIGGGFATGRTISVAANGLKDQIIINNTNGSGQWQGSVQVAGITNPLTAPNYPISNATLGNGSIARVPFTVHDASSSPINNLSEAPNNNSITNTDMMGLTQTPARSIVLEFDGPIEFTAGTPPVKVTLLGTSCSNPPDFSSSFLYTIDTGATSRRLTLTRDANAPFPKNVIVPGDYKVERLASGGLRCKGVPGTPVVAAFDYRFTVYSDCNGDGTPFSGGILEDNCGANGACDPIDFNRDGVYPSQQDTIDFDSVLGGGPCSTGNCGDIDFNNDGVFPSQDDVIAWYGVLAGDCVQCWP